MEMTVVTTKHGMTRTKKRLGLSKKLTKKKAQEAFEYGLTLLDLKGSLKRYGDELYLSREEGNDFRIFNGYVYIFRKSTFITVFSLPRQYQAYASKLQNIKTSTRV